MCVCRSTPVRWRLFFPDCRAPSGRSWLVLEPVWRNAGTSVASRASRARRLCWWRFQWLGRDDRWTRQHRHTVKMWKRRYKAFNYQRLGCTRLHKDNRRLSTELRSVRNVIWAFQGLGEGGRDVKWLATGMMTPSPGDGVFVSLSSQFLGVCKIFLDITTPWESQKSTDSYSHRIKM